MTTVSLYDKFQKRTNTFTTRPEYKYNKFLFKVVTYNTLKSGSDKDYFYYLHNLANKNKDATFKMVDQMVST